MLPTTFSTIAFSGLFGLNTHKYSRDIDGYVANVRAIEESVREKFGFSHINLRNVFEVIDDALCGMTRGICEYPQALEVAHFLEFDNVSDWLEEFLLSNANRANNPFVNEDLRKRFDEAYVKYETLPEAIAGRSVIAPADSERMECSYPQPTFDMTLTGTMWDYKVLRDCIGAAFTCERDGISEVENLRGCPPVLLKHYLDSYYDPDRAFKIALMLGADKLASEYVSRAVRSYHKGAVCAHAYLTAVPRTFARVRAAFSPKFDEFCLATFTRLYTEDFEFTDELLNDYIELAPETTFAMVSSDPQDHRSDTDMMAVLSELYLVALERNRMALASTLAATVIRRAAEDREDREGNSFVTIECLAPERSVVGAGAFSPRVVRFMQSMSEFGSRAPNILPSTHAYGPWEARASDE